MTSLNSDRKYNRNNESLVIEPAPESDCLDVSAPAFSDDDGEITLESILAEYKGTAYIAGDKKTPSSLLQEKTEKIILETAGGKYGQSQQPFNPKKKSGKELTAVLPSLEEIAKAKNSGSRSERAYTSDSVGDALKQERPALFKLHKDRFAAGEASDNTVNEVNQAIERQSRLEEETKRSVKTVFGIFNRNQGAEDDELDLEQEDFVEAQEPDLEEIIEEPDFKAATKRFAASCNSYSMRSFVSLIISVVMAILTLVFQSGAELPFGIGRSDIVITGTLLIFLLLAMLLSIDRLVAGFFDFFRKGPGIESLNLVSCLVTAAAAEYSIITHNTQAGMPYCVISAFSLTFTLWGEKIYYRALTETMKTAVSVQTPVGVIAKMADELGKTVIKKVTGSTAGFYNNLMQADIGETLFKLTAPVLMIASAALAFYASVGHGQSQYFLHDFAAIMSAAVPFSAALVFAVPFSAVAKRARKLGAAIAGWGGADDLFYTDGVSITDEDLFPTGTVSLGSVKIFDEIAPEKAIRYTASLIVVSGSGLSRLFSEHLSKQGMTLNRVEEFSCYEGGIGGLIKGERVITGSDAFMNLMGIRIPNSLNVKNAIFTAVNKKLIAVFVINYVPVKSVQNALVAVLKHRVKLFFAIRDFNITPIMLEQKYRVSIAHVEYIPIQDSYDISDGGNQEVKNVSAVLTRDGLGPYAEAITAGRRLRTTTFLAAVFSLITAGAGILLMFTICWSGSFASGSAGNLLLYMLSMLSAVLVVCGFAKYKL